MRPIRTLLVDDSGAFLASLESFLADHPLLCIVGKATSGSEGINQVVQLRPDLVLLDLIMAGMSGLEVLRRIKTDSDPPRVIVLTFQNDPAFRSEAQTLGADDFLVKAEIARRLLPVVEALFPEAER